MNIRYFYLTFFIILGFTFCIAGPPPPPGGGTPDCWPPPCVPIDGGISLLIAAGAIYGGKKLYNKAKNNNKSSL
jgi:hypothetical protein